MSLAPVSVAVAVEATTCEVFFRLVVGVQVIAPEVALLSKSPGLELVTATRVRTTVVVLAVVFVVAVFVFGRGERMAPLPAQTSPAELPDRGITAQDVHNVKFAMALRGYRMSDVDWTLERLALRIDELTKQVDQLRGEPMAGTWEAPAENLAVGSVGASVS